mgnify:CR=1 FL=1
MIGERQECEKNPLFIQEISCFWEALLTDDSTGICVNFTNHFHHIITYQTINNRNFVVRMLLCILKV